MRTAILLTGLVALLPVRPAAAQVIEPPTRSADRQPAVLDSRRIQQSLTLDVNALGGYQDNTSPDGQLALDSGTPRRSGTSALVGLQVNHRVGRGRSSLESSARSYLNSFRTAGVSRQIYGDARVSGLTHRAGLDLGGQLQTEYRPTYSFALPIGEGSTIGASDPTLAVAVNRALNTSTTGDIGRPWSERQRTNVGISYSRMRLQDGSTSADSIGALVNHTWNVTRNVAVRPLYRYSEDTNQSTTGGSLTLNSHVASLGVELTKRLSRTRQLTVLVVPGATHVDTQSSFDGSPLTYTLPSGSLSTRMDLWRTWALSFDWQRDVSLLDGLARRTFVVDTTWLSLGGALGDRMVLAVNGSWASGAPRNERTGAFETLMATSQLSYRVARCCALLANYSYGRHRLEDPSAVQPGFPRNFEGNTLRAGMTYWLPILGRFTSSRRQPRPRN